MLSTRLQIRRPFTSSPSTGARRPALVCAAASNSRVTEDEIDRKVAAPRNGQTQQRSTGATTQKRMAAATDDVKTTDGGNFRRGGRQEREPRAQPKLFMPLPKPAHLVYIKPTVAVVADIASRNSVGVKMTAGDKKLESYVIEFYSRRL